MMLSKVFNVLTSNHSLTVSQLLDVMSRPSHHWSSFYRLDYEVIKRGESIALS